MTPIMSKSDAAALVVAARIRRGLTWAKIAEELDAPLVWTTAALLGQHPMTATRPRGPAHCWASRTRSRRACGSSRAGARHPR